MLLDTRTVWAFISFSHCTMYSILYFDNVGGLSTSRSQNKAWELVGGLDRLQNCYPSINISEIQHPDRIVLMPCYCFSFFQTNRFIPSRHTSYIALVVLVKLIDQGCRVFRVEFQLQVIRDNSNYRYCQLLLSAQTSTEKSQGGDIDTAPSMYIPQFQRERGDYFPLFP